MKKWAFVSDFDGTISDEDFYWIVINKYFSDGKELFRKWKEAEILDIDFLSQVFTSIHQEENQIIEDILSIPIDQYVPTFINHVQKSNGDFYILSAGTDYYINHIINKFNISNVKVISNEGFYHEKNIHLKIDPNHKHYSQRYGIDKSKVIQDLKKEYEIVHFIGDSEPDSHPAQYADLTFAKSALQSLLLEKDIPFVAVNNFKEVEQYLIQHGMMSL
ncbi:MtnX-like HAD-IB family phosphatase [Bacillus sp. 31A1R]|uniref:MtnX-like HAD-IB family phosphatase n=1 Tax=Robertmurraya mangrovi TaxID=3098077 RepID=A0ABU5J368_9BACI|nr:MtnX-like HAD-IB family phosphatase [Bacillus sp. 31A1R]MDZ5473871.1 MtnX-like HAD-IB family phosphatase [Bacillus sp. 31A1R]